MPLEPAIGGIDVTFVQATEVGVKRRAVIEVLHVRNFMRDAMQIESEDSDED